MSIVKKFEGAVYDTKLMDEVIKRTVSSSKFKRVLTGQANLGTNPKNQWLYDENKHIYNSIISVLIEEKEGMFAHKSAGGNETTKSKAAMKSMIQTTVMAKIDTLDLPYKILSKEKFKWAIRVNDVDYEVSVVSHKDKIHEGAPTSIAKPAQHLISITSWFQDCEIKVVKGNQITLEKEGRQCSIKITRKRGKLF